MGVPRITGRIGSCQVCATGVMSGAEATLAKMASIPRHVQVSRRLVAVSTTQL